MLIDADGLQLRAPRVERFADGTLNLDAPPTGEHLSVEETERLRDARGRAAPDPWPPPPPPFFNDALLSYQSEDQTTECRIDALMWRHERDDGVLYLPSSPLHRNVSVAPGWLYLDQEELRTTSERVLAKSFVDNDVRVDQMTEEEQRSLRRSLRLEDG